MFPGGSEPIPDPNSLAFKVVVALIELTELLPYLIALAVAVVIWQLFKKV
jgi:hypothetical protein